MPDSAAALPRNNTNEASSRASALTLRLARTPIYPPPLRAQPPASRGNAVAPCCPCARPLFSTRVAPPVAQKLEGEYAGVYERRWLGNNLFVLFSAVVFSVRCGAIFVGLPSVTRPPLGLRLSFSSGRFYQERLSGPPINRGTENVSDRVV